MQWIDFNKKRFERVAIPVNDRSLAAIDLVAFGTGRPTLRIWEQFFGPYPWFYAPFVGFYVGKFGLLLSEAYKVWKTEGSLEILAPSLIENSGWGQWRSISRVQFDAALSQKLVRLDKAIQSTSIVEHALEAKGRKLSSRDKKALELILPSAWVLEGLDTIDDLPHFATLLKQPSQVVEEAARGYAVIEPLAALFVREGVLRGHRVSMRLLRTRTDGTRSTRPVLNQNLDLAEIAEYFEIPIEI